MQEKFRAYLVVARAWLGLLPGVNDIVVRYAYDR